MKNSKAAPERLAPCESCGEKVADYDTISCGSVEGGYRRLCLRCFNQEIAELSGLEGFQNPDFTPVKFADCGGNVHEFYFRTRLLGDGRVAIDAAESRNDCDGYQFQIIGEASMDLFRLLERLIQRIRRALACKYLIRESGHLHIADCLVRGRVEWDDTTDGWDDGSDQAMPILIIDGQKISWKEFGRMLMSFEGWQFELKIRDKSEEF